MTKLADYIITNHALERYQQRFRGDRDSLYRALKESKKVKASLRKKYRLYNAKQSRITGLILFVISGRTILTCVKATRHEKCHNQSKPSYYSN